VEREHGSVDEIGKREASEVKTGRGLSLGISG
jgi:hypothetical protein